MQARLEQEPPLLVLRLRRTLTRDAVVDALVRALGLDPAKSAKVDGYYHELEVGCSTRSRSTAASGTRSPTSCTRTSARSPAYDRLRPAPAARRTSAMPSTGALSAGASRTSSRAAPSRGRADEPEPDEVDRLFTGSA